MYPYNIDAQVEIQDHKVEKNVHTPIANNHTNDKKISEMIVQCVDNEHCNMEYYYDLSNILFDPHDKKIIDGIRMNCIKHKKILVDIHLCLTGIKDVPCQHQKKVASEVSDELSGSMLSLIDDVEFLRQIYFMLLNLEIRDMLFEIITDKQNDAIKLSFLCSKSRLSKEIAYKKFV